MQEQKTPLPAIIRFNIDFILGESLKIKTSEEIQKRIIEICEYISTEILGKLGEKDSNELKKEMIQELSKFDVIIKELENNKEESEMLFLLTSHVGNILHAMFKKV